MTKKEIEKLAQVLILACAQQKVLTAHKAGVCVCHESSSWSFESESTLEKIFIELTTEMDRPYKNQQHKNPARKRCKIPTGRTVTITEQSGRKTRRSIKAVKFPKEI